MAVVFEKYNWHWDWKVMRPYLTRNIISGGYHGVITETFVNMGMIEAISMSIKKLRRMNARNSHGG